MDKFEQTLRVRTKTWGIFMSRARHTSVVKVEYKKKGSEDDDDDAFIPPNFFDKTFDELEIKSGA